MELEMETDATDGWDAVSLRVKIAQGERLLREMEHEPDWMQDLLRRDLSAKRALLQAMVRHAGPGTMGRQRPDRGPLSA